MKTRKIPLRTCVVTKEKLPKKELIRIVRDNQGNVKIDLTGKANGRGAYLKRDKDVFNKAKVNKILDKHLEVKVPDWIFAELDNII
ncbi:MAG: RNase P modulator RnpM [Bacilli bacterium]